MNKYVLLISLVVATRAVTAQEQDDRVGALELKVDSMQQVVDNLRDQNRQIKPNLQNPAISAAVDAIASYSDSADTINLTPRDVELMIQANVDPFAKAYIVLNAESELAPTETTEPLNEVSVGMEEAAIQTTSLPAGLAVKLGAFFADFTRLGKVHSHDLPFVDRPPSLEKIIGGENKVRGAELTWLLPVDHYIRLTVGAVDNIGAETAVNNVFTTPEGDEVDAFATDDHRSLDALTYYGRAATLFEVGSSAVLHLGVDASQGGRESTRTMASADFKLEWKPVPSGNNRFEIAGEWLTSKFDGTLSDEAMLAGGSTHGSADASGGYVYAQYRTAKWEPGIRFDYTKPESYEAGNDGLEKVKDNLYTCSAYLTAYLSEFNRVRLQANYVQSDNEIAGGHDSDTQVFLQWTVVLGAHKHDFMP